MSWSTKIESIEQLINILETDKDCSVYKCNDHNVEIYYHESFIEFRKKYKFSENLSCEMIDKFENNPKYSDDAVNSFEIEVYENAKSYYRIKILFNEDTYNEITFLLLNIYMQHGDV